MVSVHFIWNPLHVCCLILNMTCDKAVQTSCCCFFSCYQMIKHSESTVTTYVYTYDKDVEVCVSKGRTQNSPTQRKFSTTFSPFFTDRCFLPVVLKKYVLPGLVRLRMLLCYALTGEAMGTVTRTRCLTSQKWLMKQLNDHRYIGLTSDVLFFVLLFLIPLSFSLWHLNILIMISLLETACIIYV